MKKKIISERNWAIKTLGDKDFVSGVLDVEEWGCKIPYQITRYWVQKQGLHLSPDSPSSDARVEETAN